uniref:Uncharacterized protein n=1 Tax=Anguilla anguilla TaxID=7936 RepID=A0A0E9U7A0_ANGAN
MASGLQLVIFQYFTAKLGILQNLNVNVNLACGHIFIINYTAHAIKSVCFSLLVYIPLSLKSLHVSAQNSRFL